MILKNIFAGKNWRKAISTQNAATLSQKMYHYIGFQENHQFFRIQLDKVAENCDHNIDPDLTFAGTSTPAEIKR
jgi:hypothetical protein